MISVELAGKLKDAGLVWEQKPGDWAVDDAWGEMGQVYISSDGAICLTAGDVNSYIGLQEGVTWLPTLSDLLAELEKWGYIWHLSKTITPNIVFKKYCCVVVGGVGTKDKISDADTPEEACGNAVLWVLEQEKGERE